MVVVSVLELAPIVDEEPEEDVLPCAVEDEGLVVLLELLPAAVSVDGVVDPAVEPLVEAPAPVLGVVEPVVPVLPDVEPPAPAAGALLPVAPLLPDAVPPEPCAHAMPKAPASEAARTVMPNFL